MIFRARSREKRLTKQNRNPISRKGVDIYQTGGTSTHRAHKNIGISRKQVLSRGGVGGGDVELGRGVVQAYKSIGIVDVIDVNT